jgi:ABC-2 type transport system ATP-binding protein
MDNYVFKSNNITKMHGKQKALDNISLNIKKGDVYGFVGKNGAGKTSMIRIILGLSFSDSGEIELFGESNNENINLARNKIGSLIEKPIFYGNMTAIENLELIKIQRGLSDSNYIYKVLKLVNLHSTGRKKAKDFSLGMKQRLGIAMALLSKPDLLILDEPINGLDPIGIKEIRELLIKLNKEQGTTILISSHILSELTQLVTQYGFINEGKLIQEISSNDLHKICRDYIHLKVSNISSISEVFKNQLNINDYEICTDNIIKVYEKTHLENLSLILAKYNIAIYELFTKEESLEEYFSRLVGGV